MSSPVSAPLFRVSEHPSALFNAAAASHTPAVVVTVVVVTADVVSTGDSTKLNKYISKTLEKVSFLQQQKTETQYNNQKKVLNIHEMHISCVGLTPISLFFFFPFIIHGSPRIFLELPA